MQRRIYIYPPPIYLSLRSSTSFCHLECSRRCEVAHDNVMIRLDVPSADGSINCHIMT